MLYDSGPQVAAWSNMLTCPDYLLCRSCRALGWTQCSSLGQKQALSS